MAATYTTSADRHSPGTRRKKPIAAILALLCDLAAWLLVPLYWDEEGYLAAGALVTSVFLAAAGAAVALLGLLVTAIRARYNHPRPSNNLPVIALAASVISIAIFIATFNWIVIPEW